VGRYLSLEEPTEQFLSREGTELPPEDVLKFSWSDKYFLVAQVFDLRQDRGYNHSPAIVCFHERELEYIKSTIPREARHVRYYLVASSKLEGKY
jgi:hypothetical protein